MAICKSATRFDKDSYYETTVDESNDDVVVKGTKNGEPVEWSLGGGGGSSTLFTNLTIDGSTGTLDKTFGEIKQAIDAGNQVICKAVADGTTMYFCVITLVTPGDGGVIFIMGTGGTTYAFMANVDSGYPSGNIG